jgi:Peptide-N-glycosidase F, C terminal/Peptide-N-glycosidase F, N terminal
MRHLLDPRRARNLWICVPLACAGGLGCSSSHPAAAPPDGGGGGEMHDGGDDGGDAGETRDAGDAGVENGTPATFNVFDELPQFGIYDSTNPDYTPPAGVLMWSYGTVFVTKLSAEQKAQIGSDVAARVTFIAQCDNYDRLGGLFFLVEPEGHTPEPTDPRTEIVRFITPFSDFTEGPLATHVYPDADVSPYAQALADRSHDVWIGLAGGSNPYSGDPCVALDAGASFSAVGFKYSVDLVSTKPLTLGHSTVLTAVADVSESAAPIHGTFTNPGGPLTGHVTVIISGHGSGAGGDEYEHTEDRLIVSDVQVGSFSTMIDCASYAKYSPDGNPGIFQGNTTDNPRNWCPGALVPPHTFPVTLQPGSNTVSLSISPSAVPSGSYYETSINFTSP